MKKEKKKKPKVGGTRNRLPYVSQKHAQWRAQ